MDVLLHLAVAGLGRGAGWENDAMLGKGGVGGWTWDIYSLVPQRDSVAASVSREFPRSCYPGSESRGSRWGGMGVVVGVSAAERGRGRGTRVGRGGVGEECFVLLPVGLLLACLRNSKASYLPLRTCASVARLSRRRSVSIPVQASVTPAPLDNTHQPCQPSPVPWPGHLPCMRGPYWCELTTFKHHLQANGSAVTARTSSLTQPVNLGCQPYSDVRVCALLICRWNGCLFLSHNGAIFSQRI
jgi:hypothetical protein